LEIWQSRLRRNTGGADVFHRASVVRQDRGAACGWVGGLENAAPNCRTGKRGKRHAWKAKRCTSHIAAFNRISDTDERVLLKRLVTLVNL